MARAKNILKSWWAAFCFDWEKAGLIQQRIDDERNRQRLRMMYFGRGL